MVWKELIEDIQKIQIKETCSTCGKSFRNEEEGSFTSWIFKPSRCDCSSTNAEKKSIEEDEANEALFPNLGDDVEVIKSLGHGGMGSVYKVRRKKDSKIFAAKVLRTKFEDPNYSKRFRKEIEYASKLAHPGLIDIYNSGTSESGAPFFLMEFVDGKSLSEIIESDEKLTPDQILDISIQISEALSHVHKNSILHRDIKPNNILLKKESGSDSYKVILVDFGIAKILPESERKTQNLTQTSEVFGSPLYMSPEQCMGFKLDERSDIYSLGCVIYELATGSPPFSGSNPVQLIVKHIEDTASPFPTYAKGNKLIKNLEAVVLRCLDKESNNRFESVDQLIEALEKLKEGKKVPYTAIQQFRPTLSLKQAVGIFTILAFATLFVMSLTSSMYVGGLERIGLIIIMLLGLFLYSSIKLTPLGVRRARQLFQISGEPKKWWAAINYLSLGSASILMSLTLIFSIFALTSNFNNADVVIRIFYFTGVFIAINLVSCLVNYILSRSKKTVGFSYILIRQILTVAAIVVAGLTFSTPQQLSSALVSIAGDSGNQPEVKLWLAEQAYKIDPQPSTLETIAFAQHDLNRDEEAIKNISKAIKDGPNDTYLLDYKARWLLEMNRFEEAFMLADEIIETHSFTQGHRLKGLVYERKNEYQKALVEYSKAIEESVHSNDYMSDSLESRIRVYLKQKDYEKALEDLELLSSKVTTQNSYFRIGLLADYLGREKEAKQAFKKSIQLGNYTIETAERVKVTGWRKHTAGYHLLLAYAYMKIGNIDQYKLHLERAEDAGFDKSNLKYDDMPSGAIKW